jgi:hypothetical protein
MSMLDFGEKARRTNSRSRSFLEGRPRFVVAAVAAASDIFVPFAAENSPRRACALSRPTITKPARRGGSLIALYLPAHRAVRVILLTVLLLKLATQM